MNKNMIRPLATAGLVGAAMASFVAIAQGDSAPATPDLRSSFAAITARAPDAAAAKRLAETQQELAKTGLVVEAATTSRTIDGVVITSLVGENAACLLLTSAADGSGLSLNCAPADSAANPSTPLATAFVGKSRARTAVALAPDGAAEARATLGRGAAASASIENNVVAATGQVGQDIELAWTARDGKPASVTVSAPPAK